MLDLDSLLQQSLKDLEEGKVLEAVLADLPAEAAELRPLIETAARLRAGPPIVMPQPQRTALRAQVVETARREIPTVKSPQQSAWGWLGVPAVFGVLTVFLVTALVLGGLGLWFAGPPTAHAAELVEITGPVEVATFRAPDAWKAVTDASRIHAGDFVRTGPGGSAALVYFDGSRTAIGENTQLTLTRLDGQWGKVLQVEITQQMGETWHSVVPFKGKQALFVVFTPTGEARVHGTQFSVLVGANGVSRMAVERGVVAVSSEAGEIDLTAGQTSRLDAGQAPQLMGYGFSLNEPLVAADKGQLILADMTIQMNDQTMLSNEGLKSGLVHIEGYVQADGSWMADSVGLTTQPGDKSSHFSGKIETMEGDLWQIGGESVLVNDVTELKGNLAVGQVVKVEFVNLDGGRWLALEIKALDDVEDEGELTSGEPVTGTTTGTVTGTVTGTITGTVTACTGSEPHPTGTELAQRYSVPYEEIMGWFCQGFGFGEIDLAYSLALETGLPVDQIFAMKQNGMGWGNVRRELSLSTTVTTTVPVEINLEGEPLNQGAMCTGQNVHPTGTRLAERFGVPYEQVMTWFCQGYGFGEIDMAYTLSKQSGTPVEQIFALKQGGMGWGEIKKQFETVNTPPGKDPKDKKQHKP